MNYSISIFRYVLMFSSFWLTTLKIHAQKNIIEQDTYKEWPEISGETISNDGSYILYDSGNKISGGSYYIKATINNWSMAIADSICENPFFTEDSKRLIYTSKNKLEIFNLSTKNIEFEINNVSSFESTKHISHNYLVYKKLGSQDSLFVMDLEKNKVTSFPHVSSYKILKASPVVLLFYKDKLSSAQNICLKEFDFRNNKQQQLWSGNELPSNIMEHLKSGIVTFFTSDSSEIKKCKIWCYKPVLKKVAELTPDLKELNADFDIDLNWLTFDLSGTHIFVKLISTKAKFKEEEKKKTGVEIWSYSSKFLPTQLDAPEHANSIITSINIETGKLVFITNHDEYINYYGNGFVVVKTKVNEYESFWDKTQRPDVYAVSVDSGNRFKIKEKIFSKFDDISPDGNYYLYYDNEDKNYYCYSFFNNNIVNITKSIPFPIYNEDYDNPGPPTPYNFNGFMWSDNEQYVYIYDKFDIWKVDPRKGTRPQNITKNFGRLYDITFRFDKTNQKLKNGDTTLVYAFNHNNKNAGMYYLIMGQSKVPTEIFMKAVTYSNPSFGSSYYNIYNVFTKLNSPIKAKFANSYLFRMGSATEYPNVYVLNNFGQHPFKTSDFHPQKNFNWMTAELENYKSEDNQPLAGILYKPENFDPRKKYPIILYLYQRMTDGINQFIYPELRPGDLSIPYFVSHGYLIFLPDIHYKIGEPGASTLNCVLASTKMLKSLPYVDSTRLGVQGISWGGYEVNYLITHSNIFKAAATCAGTSNFIDKYGELALDAGFCLNWKFEAGQMRMGKSLWADPEGYIANSPIFFLERVTTPVLIMHNRKDPAVPFEQGLQLFNGLRRLQKKCWLLQYSNGNHGVWNEDAVDYSKKLTEFFNYYLKDDEKPEWMTDKLNL